MKKSIRIIALVLVFVAVLFTLPFMPVTKAAELPKNLRVGIYYKDTYLNTSVASFCVAAANGVSIGTELNGDFIEMLKHTEASALTVRRDTYFIKETSKEYNPNVLPIPEGEKLGPYHIKIANDYTDMASAIAAIDLLKQSGISAYLAYTDVWQVWTGFFTDIVTAQTHIDQTLKPIVGEAICTIIEPKSTSSVITKIDGSTILIYASSTNPLQFKPSIENTLPVLKLDKNQFRGRLEVRRILGSDMTVINIVSICDYLSGSVPAEIGGKSPPEALKAQALAAKMYALNSRGKHSKQAFDICNSVHCQVYKGYNLETSQVNAAVEAIKDKIITYNGKPAGAIFYFSSSGGYTESNENVWGTPYPYLVSVEDKYETGKTYNAVWTKTVKAIDIRKQMPEIGDVLGISILGKSSAGRAISLAVKGTLKQNEYRKDRCRTIFSLPSQMYSITTDADISILGASNISSKGQIGARNILTSTGLKAVKPINNKITILGAGGVKKLVAAIPENYIFAGKGWGHAIGMSQSGAIGMANAGFTYDQILTHYFQGTAIQ